MRRPVFSTSSRRCFFLADSNASETSGARSGNSSSERRLGLAAGRVERRVALLLVADRHGRLDLLVGELRDLADDHRILRGRNELALRLAHRRAQLLLQVDQRLGLLVREHQRVDDDLLADLAAAALDHDDGVTVAGDDQVDVRRRALREGRVDDELALDAADADARERARPGDVGEVQRRRGAGHRQHVGRVLAVGREDHRDHLACRSASPWETAGATDDR